MPWIERYDTPNKSLAPAPKPETKLTRAESNRLNGAMSKGPITEEGKAKSSRNACKHGLTSGNPVTPSDDPIEYEAHRTRIWEELRPQDAVQEFLCDRVASCSWRLRRVVGIESQLLASSTKDTRGFEHGPGWAPCSGSYIALTRYERAIERSLFQSLDTLRTLQATIPGKN